MDSEIPYAAFGLIVKDSWAYLLDDYSAYIHFDGTFVQKVLMEQIMDSEKTISVECLHL